MTSRLSPRTGVFTPASIKSRSVALAGASRIMGGAVVVASALSARLRRVFAVRKVSTPVHLHADEFGIGASHARGKLTQEYGNV